MIEKRRLDPRVLLEELRTNPTYQDYVFKQTISRKATIGRLPIYGFRESNKELMDACQPYIDVVEEPVKRVCA